MNVEDDKDSSMTAEVARLMPGASGSEHRYYKACRTCRRQKMRCDGTQGIACRRCRNARVECVFDPATPRKRVSYTERPGQKQKLQVLHAEVGALKDQIASLRGVRPPPIQEEMEFQPLSENNHQQPTISSVPSDSVHGDDTIPYHDLSPENLSVPVTAVHVMMYPPLQGEVERNAAGWTVENQSKWNRNECSQSLHEDIVTRKLVDDTEARQLFELFMHGCNTFLPLFDPLLDTFDSIRERSTFSFTVLLFVAARQRYRDKPDNPTLAICREESRKLAADSLFENPSSLDKTEAMAILAVHSDKTWFALGHAFQMGLDLGLPAVMERLISSSSSSSRNLDVSGNIRYNARCARAWLMIVQFERAIALGGGRASRSQNLFITDLEHCLEHELLRPSDITFCATIDLLQTCVYLQVNWDPPVIEQVESTLDLWWKKWDVFYEHKSVHSKSFQRVHLRIQLLCSKVIQGGVLLVRRLQPRLPPHRQGLPAQEEASNVSKYILRMIQETLRFIDKSEAYKRLFKWAPTYDGLVLTFVVILGFKVLALYPDSEEQRAFMDTVVHAAHMLEQYPCQKFHQVVERLILRAKSPVAVSETVIPRVLEDNNRTSANDYSGNIATGWLGEGWIFDLSSNGLLDFMAEDGVNL